MNCVLLLLLLLTTTAAGAFQEKQPEQSSLTARSTRCRRRLRLVLCLTTFFPEAKQTKQNKQKTKISTNGLSCEDFLNIIISEELQRPITLSLCHFYDYCPPPSHSVWSPHTLSYGIWLFAKKPGVCVCVCDSNVFTVD